MIVSEGIRLTIENNWEMVEIESDTQNVIRQLRKEDYHWRTTTLTANILHMAESRRQVTWNTITRTTNKCAN